MVTSLLLLVMMTLTTYKDKEKDEDNDDDENSDVRSANHDQVVLRFSQLVLTH